MRKYFLCDNTYTRVYDTATFTIAIIGGGVGWCTTAWLAVLDPEGARVHAEIVDRTPHDVGPQHNSNEKEGKWIQIVLVAVGEVVAAFGCHLVGAAFLAILTGTVPGPNLDCAVKLLPWECTFNHL